MSIPKPKRFGSHLPPVVRPFPTELPRAERRTERLDDLFEPRDASLLHHECQSTHTPDIPPRFLSYDVALYLATKRTIHTVIFIWAKGAKNSVTARTLVEFERTLEKVR